MVYALLVERADSGDAVMLPTLLASGKVKPEALDDLRARGEIDSWLGASIGVEADAEEALVSWLRG